MGTINNQILNFADKLIPISDFSKGKTAQIFEDVKNNNAEYIVLKNNQPSAIILSPEEYTRLTERQEWELFLMDMLMDISDAFLTDMSL